MDINDLFKPVKSKAGEPTGVEDPENPELFIAEDEEETEPEEEKVKEEKTKSTPEKESPPLPESEKPTEEIPLSQLETEEGSPLIERIVTPQTDIAKQTEDKEIINRFVDDVRSRVDAIKEFGGVIRWIFSGNEKAYIYNYLTDPVDLKNKLLSEFKEFGEDYMSNVVDKINEQIEEAKKEAKIKWAKKIQ